MWDYLAPSDLMKVTMAKVTPETKIASLDKQLERAEFKTWYDEGEVTPDELLDRRLALMAERDKGREGEAA